MHVNTTKFFNNHRPVAVLCCKQPNKRAAHHKCCRTVMTMGVIQGMLMLVAWILVVGFTVFVYREHAIAADKCATHYYNCFLLTTLTVCV